MGRASNQASAAASSPRGFDAVIGARRGSPRAQAARDAAEADTRAAQVAARERERERQARRDDQRAAGEAFCAAQSAAVGGWRFADYALSVYDPDSGRYPSPVFAQMVAALRKYCQAGEGASELARCVAAGDPPALPGLTGPWQAALAHHLGNDPRPRDLRTSIIQLFGAPAESAHYARLSDIADAIGTRLIQDGESARLGFGRAQSDEICTLAARVLAGAPLDALDGALASWMTAFERRLRDELCSEDEWDALCVLVARDPVRFAALGRKLDDYPA